MYEQVNEFKADEDSYPLTLEDTMQANQTINLDGDTWRIVSVGATDDQGRVYVHLASETRFQVQRNGRRPIQISDWVDRALVSA